MWYFYLKTNKTEQSNKEYIRHLSDQDQGEQIAGEFSKIENEYKPSSKDNIQVSSDLSVFSPSQVPTLAFH